MNVHSSLQTWLRDRKWNPEARLSLPYGGRISEQRIWLVTHNNSADFRTNGCLWMECMGGAQTGTKQWKPDHDRRTGNVRRENVTKDTAGTLLCCSTYFHWRLDKLIGLTVFGLSRFGSWLRYSPEEHLWWKYRKQNDQQSSWTKVWQNCTGRNGSQVYFRFWTLALWKHLSTITEALYESSLQSYLHVLQ